MAGFGGAVKLTGESEYKRALNQITQALREVDSELKLVSSQYDKNDKSEDALISKSDALSKKLETQKSKVDLLTASYKDLESKAEANRDKHKALADELDKETKRLEDIARDSGKASDEYKEQAAKVADLSTEYKNSVKNIDEQERSLSRARTELNNATSEMNKTESELADLGREFDSTADDADDLSKATKDAGDAAEKSTSGWTVLKGVLSDIASTAIQSVLSELRGIANEAIEASDSLEKFGSTMSFAGYDSATIEQAQKDVKNYADKTVYDLQTIANTSAQLAANGIEDFTGLTEAAGNLNAIAGGSKDTFQSVAMVLTQTAGVGKLTGENWRQLANAIPGATGVIQQALADAGAYTGDFQTAMSEGQITAEEFNAAIMQLGNEPIAVEAAKSTSTFEGSIAELRATAVNGFMEIFDAIGKENITDLIGEISAFVADVIPPLVDAVSWFIDNLPAIAPILAAIAGGLTALMVAQKISAVVTAFQAWRAATQGMTIAQAALNVVMNANPIMLIVTLLGALVAALVVAWNTNDEFREKLTGAWDNIKETFEKVWTGIEKFFTETMPNFFTGAANTVKEKLTEMRNNIATFFTNIKNNATDGARDFVNNMVTKIKELPSKIKEQLNAAYTNVKNFSTDAVNKAKSAGSDFVSNMVTKVKELPAKIWGELSSAISKVAEFGNDIRDKATSAGSDFVNNLINKITTIPAEIAGAFADAITEAANFVIDFAAKATEAGEDFFNNIVDKVDDIPDEMLSIGKDIISGVWDGIQSKMSWFEDKIENSFVGRTVGKIANAFGIGSPSRVMRDEVGVWLAEGVGVGFTERMRDVTQDMIDSMPTEYNAPEIVGGAEGYSADGSLTTNAALVNAFIDALEGVQVELDDVNMGRFVRKTVTDAIYT